MQCTPVARRVWHSVTFDVRECKDSHAEPVKACTGWLVSEHELCETGWQYHGYVRHTMHGRPAVACDGILGRVG